MTVDQGISTHIQPDLRRGPLADYLASPSTVPLIVSGDAISILASYPSACIDMCMTSPPYWGKRKYSGGGIGLERDYHEYIEKLLAIFAQLKRLLKPTGSFWLNIGDSYLGKKLLGLPWRVAIQLMDRQGWTLRNDVVWNKVKGSPDNAADKLRNVHEYVFHFVTRPQGYFYDIDAIRNSPRNTKVVNGHVVSATGVRGVRYRRQIELSTSLTPTEKAQALAALETTLNDLQAGKVSDFRMIIRQQQRATHSDSEAVSGRAKELMERGFYFLKYHPKGAKPADVWDIIPEDTQARTEHFAPYPEDLCRLPILATCPPGGVVLDPFCGTGTTLLVAHRLGRKSIGIDISEQYVTAARARCARLL